MVDFAKANMQVYQKMILIGEIELRSSSPE
jgi:hypothetical protein